MVERVEGRVRVAVAQPLVIPGDVKGNIKRMRPLVVDAARLGARLVLFSEDSLNGYDFSGACVASAIQRNGPELNAVRQLASRNNIAVVAGFFERENDRLFNAAAVAFPDGGLVVQRKHVLTPTEISRYHVENGPSERTVFLYEGLKWAILICADGGIRGVYKKLKAAACDVVLAPTAGLGSDTHAFHQTDLANAGRLQDYIKAASGVCFISPEKSIRRNMAMVCCNQMGYSAIHRYFQCGHAAVIDRTGETTALIPGRFIVEHLRPQVAVGFVSAKNVARKSVSIARADSTLR